MKNSEIIITSYPNPDLDGTACVFAYSEFLNKQGTKAIPVIFGTPHVEAQFVLKKFNIPDFQNGNTIIDDTTKVIIVDSSDPEDIPKTINPNQVIEIIDHRKIHQADKFPNAKTKIELVGSAATLIGERFQQEKIKPSKEAAALLFSAIVSNTINFQGDVTTDRDKKITKWLKSIAGIPAGYIEEMFVKKSKIDEPLFKVFQGDLKKGLIGSKRFGIAQLEIVGVEKFIDDRLQEIKQTLSEIKNNNNFHFTFLNCIDIKEAFNMFVVEDIKTQELLEKSLKLRFKNGVAKNKSILMRKQIIPILKSD